MARPPVYTPRRGRVRAFLYVHGPDVGCCALAVACALIVGADYALNPQGFVRFVVAVICALA